VSLSRSNEIPTRPSLLLLLRDAQNAQAWEQFVDIYAPLVHGFCRRRGLQEADAADVAQETMTAVAQAIRKFEYDPGKGKFRNWLLTVVRSKFNNFVAHQRRQPEPVEVSTLELQLDQTAAATETTGWEDDYYRRIFQWGAERIRREFSESTWQAFWRTGVEARDGKEVAEALGLSIGAVYAAKSRVIARLKEEIRNVDEDGAMPLDLAIDRVRFSTPGR
jgi:RNA polymerase sigma-70 factor (ECF subfamily)